MHTYNLPAIKSIPEVSQAGLHIPSATVHLNDEGQRCIEHAGCEAKPHDLASSLLPELCSFLSSPYLRDDKGWASEYQKLFDAALIHDSQQRQVSFVSKFIHACNTMTNACG